MPLYAGARLCRRRLQAAATESVATAAGGAIATEQQQPPVARDSSSVAAGEQQPSAADASLPVTVRPASGLLELRQVARLRAEAYYADDRSRFAESFKRQFAAQEVESLQHRTAPRGGRAPQCDCLVAVDASPDGGAGSGLVVGCIDIRLPQAATGAPASGVPADEQPGGAYLLNVVVDARARGRGVGRALMRAAMARAVGVWGATRLFTHVEAGNDVAAALYRGCGFAEHSGSAAYDGAAVLGRLLLLAADASAVTAAELDGAAAAAAAGAGAGNGGGDSGNGSSASAA